MVSLFFGMVLLCLIVPSSSAQQYVSKPKQTGALSGVVLNSATSNPIAGATVIAQEAEGSQDVRRAAITGTDGRFSIVGLPFGSYFVMAERSGYAGQDHAGVGSTKPGPVPVDGGEIDDIELRLTPWAALSGLIADWNGEPVIGAKVDLVQARITDGRFVLATVAKVTTNDLGHFRIFGMRPGRYYLRAFYRDNASLFGLRSRPDSTDASTEDYAVTYYPDAISPDEATPILALPGQPVSGLDIRLRMVRSAKVSGVVDGLPSGLEAPLFLEPADKTAIGALQLFTVKSSAGSNFHFESVPPGEYVLSTQVTAGNEDLSARERVTISGSPIENFIVRLKRSPSLAGTVKVIGAGSLSGDFALLFTGSDARMSVRAPVDPEGSFIVPSLRIDEYRVKTENPDSGLIQEVRLVGRTLNGGIVNLESSIDSLEILVSTSNGGITGRVLESTGDALSGRFVLATGSTGSYISRTDSHGAFRIGPLLPGEYRIISYSDVLAAEYLSRGALIDLRRRGEVVSVAENETVSIDLEAVRSTTN